MSSDPYIQFFGLDFTDIMDVDGISSSGGNRKVNSYSLPDSVRSYTNDNGTDEVKWSGEFHSSSLTNIKDIINEFKRAPSDVEFYPIDSDLCIYSAFATARFSHPKVYTDGSRYNYHYGNFEVISNEPVAFGVRQGIEFDGIVALPTSSATLTNDGTMGNTIDYFCASGYYDDSLGYTDDLKLTINEYELPLCAQLMAHDKFELSRWGEVVHSYELSFFRPYETLVNDLWGTDFVNGGSMDGDSLTLTDGQIMIPFTGPLPVSETPPPTLDFHIESGTFTVWQSFCGDLSDISEVDVEVERGHNIIEIPDCDGVDFVSFGLLGTGVITELNATVKRYLAESELPEIDIDDEFTIDVSDGSYSNHLLTNLQALYRDKYSF